MAQLRDAHETPDSPIVISGNIGPRGDGYRPDAMMSAEEAQAYHAEQVQVFRETAADFVSAFTINYVNEAIGIARAAKSAGMPVVLSFTVETDGRLPTGQTLKDAIIATDAATEQAPAYYMLNCAHPTHFQDALADGESWVKRLRGLRANASTRSHAELDAASDLDAGDPVALGRHYRDLRKRMPQLERAGRLLRHRPPARRTDLLCLHVHKRATQRGLKSRRTIQVRRRDAGWRSSRP